MKSFSTLLLVIAVGCLALGLATSACAQCSTCPTPVVAYSPVVTPAPVVAAAPVVTYEPARGWYPGKLLDTWRLRRWGYTAPATTYTAAYAPYTVGYAPTVTAAYAPTTYTAGYAPYSVSYAPAYTPTSYVTSYAPLQRQVVMSPVVAAAPVISSGCSTCSACEVAAPCSSCAAATVVEQATYAAAPAPAPCTNCAPSNTVIYSDTSTSSSSQTPKPELAPGEGGQSSSNYPNVEPPKNPQYPDPGPASTDKASESTYLEPPALFIPGDRTAQHESAKPINRAPSVNVWNAVYREPINVENTSTGQSQAEIDAAGWSSVPAN
jgi:hypothetical protein